MTLKNVKTLALRLGATVEDDKSYGFHECRVEAPKGKRWACDSIHELVDSVHQPWKPDYADVLSRMEYGIEDCQDSDCEWCNPED